MTRQYCSRDANGHEEWHDEGTGPAWMVHYPNLLHWRDKPSPEHMTQPSSIDTTIPNRDHQHGGIDAVGEISQNLKQGMRRSLNWGKLTSGEREALDMLAHKVARILSGADPHDPEHWEDLAGYPMAVIRGRSA
jgi:hypothetical protein